MFRRGILLCAFATLLINSCSSIYWRKVPKDINPSSLSKEEKAEYDSLMIKLTNQNRWHIPPHKTPEIIDIKKDSIPERFWTIISYDELIYTDNSKAYYGAAIDALSKQEDTSIIKVVQDMYYKDKGVIWKTLPNTVAGQYDQFTQTINIDTLKNKNCDLVKTHEGKHQWDYRTQEKAPIRIKGISSFIAFTELLAHTNDFTLQKSGYGFEKKEFEDHLYKVFENEVYYYIYKRDIENFFKNPSVQELLKKAKSKQEKVIAAFQKLNQKEENIIKKPLLGLFTYRLIFSKIRLYSTEDSRCACSICSLVIPSSNISSL